MNFTHNDKFALRTIRILFLLRHIFMEKKEKNINTQVWLICAHPLVTKYHAVAYNESQDKCKKTHYWNQWWKVYKSQFNNGVDNALYVWSNSLQFPWNYFHPFC